jgi:S1-C subfamily serine protease
VIFLAVGDVIVDAADSTFYGQLSISLSHCGRMPSFASTLRDKPGARHAVAYHSRCPYHVARPERRSCATSQSDAQQIYERFAATVVFIVATPDHGTGMGGTGSIIGPDGLILTNAHVVVDSTDHRPYSQISIFLKPERVTGNPKTDLAKRFTARVIATSESLDLALLQTEQAPTLPTITFGDPATVRIGDRVLAIGPP